MHALRSLPEVYRASVPPGPPPIEETYRRCVGAPSWWLAGERAELAILAPAPPGLLAGHLSLAYRDRLTQQAMICYALRPEFRGRGLATRAARLVTEWAFSIGIARVVADTTTDNLASHGVLTRAGFTPRGSGPRPPAGP